MTPSTPASTDAGALAATRLAAADAIRTFCKSLGVGAVAISSDGVERIYYAGISLDALSVAVTMALRNSAPQETRGDEPVAAIDLRSALQLLDSLDRIAEDFRQVQPCRHNNDNVISELKIELAGLREALAASQQSPRLGREGIARIIDPGAWELKDIGYTLPKFAVEKSLSKADAILALLSPDTTVASSTERGGGK